MKELKNLINQILSREITEGKIIINHSFIGVKVIELFGENYLYIGHIGSDTGKVFNIGDYVYEYYDEFISSLEKVLEVEKPF